MSRNIAAARAAAFAAGLRAETLRLSAKPGKRFSILNDEGRRIDFGAWPFARGTFIDHGDEDVRAAWRARHSKILKRGYPAWKDPNSPEFYAWRVLW